jgi:hypothetical protein
MMLGVGRLLRLLLWNCLNSFINSQFEIMKEGNELLKNSPSSLISSEISIDKLVSAFGVSTRSGPYTHVSYNLYQGIEHTACLLKFPNVTHIFDTVWLAHMLSIMGIFSQVC